MHVIKEVGLMKTVKKRFCLVFFVLLTTLLIAGCPKEGCDKLYFITGVVTDIDTNPLADVQVFMGETLLSASNADGSYEILYPPDGSTTMSNFGGYRLRFVKTGYVAYEAKPFSGSEAGFSVCGSVELKRDAVLELE